VGGSGDEGPDGFEFVHFCEDEVADDEIDALDVACFGEVEGQFLEGLHEVDLVLGDVKFKLVGEGAVHVFLDLREGGVVALLDHVVDLVVGNSLGAEQSEPLVF
jgi:hypothetical protein